MASPTQPATAPSSKVPPGILRLAGPLVLSFWFRSAFQWVDTIYASTLDQVGDASIAAIGLTLPFEFLMIACWVGCSNALTSRLAAAMGAGQGERISQLEAAARRLTWGLSGLFVLVALAVYAVTPYLGLEEQLAGQFRIYGTVLLAGSAFTTFWSILPDSTVKAHQDTRSTMWAGIASTLTNVVLNTLFVFVFHWGIAGIALATVLGRFGGLAYALHRARLLEEARRAGGGFEVPGLFPRPIRALLVLALPAGLSFVFLSLESFAFNGLLAKADRFLPGADATSLLAGWSILDRAARFLVIPIIAIGVAVLPLVAHLSGSGDFARMRRELRTAGLASLAYVLVCVVPLAWFLGPSIAAWLTDSPAAREAAISGLRWIPLAVLLGAPVFLLRPTFEGLQLPRPGLAVSALRSLVFVPVLAGLGFTQGGHLGLDAIGGLVLGLALGAGLASLVAWGLARRTLAALESEQRAG
ncbi:MAG: MATE family efflux transporter [Planctomycetota bacterium]|nr:MATE family efflux transporter [Planctomycetota bacterium]